MNTYYPPSRFFVGDIVKAEKETNRHYSITTLKNEYIGEVVSIRGNFFTLKTISCKTLAGKDSIFSDLYSPWFSLLEESHASNDPSSNPSHQEEQDDIFFGMF